MLSRSVKRHFITGLAVALPVIATFVIIWVFLKLVAGWSVELLKLLPFLRRLPGPVLLVIGLTLLVGLVYFVGLGTNTYLGRKLVRLTEEVMTKPPFIKSVYSASRQVVKAILEGKRPTLRRVVLVQFPYRGVWALGFVTNPEPWVIKGKPHLNVYVPTTPNPTSGWYMLVPEDEVLEVDIGVEEGLKLVISGGIVLEGNRFPEVSDALEKGPEESR